MRKKSDRTITVIFIIVCLISVVIGFFVGGIAMRLSSSNTVAGMFEAFCDNAIRIIPYFSCLLNLIMCIIGFCLYIKSSRMADTWDGENEDIIDSIEGRLTITLVIPSVMMILNFLCFGIAFAGDAHLKDGITPENIALCVAFLTFVLSFVWETVLQGKVIALEKKLNPEKRGNILDFKFRSEWIESCDEAERMIIYRSSYDVYKLMANLFIYAWLLTFVVSAATNTGVFAMVMVTALWLMQTVAYFKAASKYGK